MIEAEFIYILFLFQLFYSNKRGIRDVTVKICYVHSFC